MQKEKFISGMNGHIVLSPRERERIIQRSVEREHWKTKSTICMEEMAELQQQISKQIRGYDDRYGLLEEMADVYISLKLLESIFNVTPEEMQKAIDAITLIRKSRGADIIFKDPKIRLGYVAGYDDGKIDAEREKMRKEETK